MRPTQMPSGPQTTSLPTNLDAQPAADCGVARREEAEGNPLPDARLNEASEASITPDVAAKRLRILGIRGIPAAHGGFETFAEHLALYLVKHGWEVRKPGFHREMVGKQEQE